ncbi:ubiquitin thioesterase otulin-like isoform X2 [Polyodon spathula]|uniref:ubiquitin thioesterase otulin-like isoform X2 n=1 Tax=Polyodon spathula TaxID=7913 RepID=UPI001B7DC89B|nr:ubiquitin thioesterase otulin-like isoform X2 [Polyodon spathula]
MPACSETWAEDVAAVHQESQSISLQETLAAGLEPTAHTTFSGSVTEATVIQEEHEQPASCTETKSGKFPVIEKINQTACIDNLQHGNGPAGLVNDAVQEDVRCFITEAAGEGYQSLASSCNSEVDLYRGAEEIEEDLLEKNGAKCVDDFMDKCSISPEVDILIYSESEWRGNTAKSAQIKKAYEEVHKSFSGLRRVRGDNYCALRATLFQALIQSKEVPAWLQREDFIQLPEKLASCYDWLKQWRVTQEYTNGNLMELLKGHVQLLKKKWLAVVESSSAEERQAVCDEIFRNEEEEYSLLEAVKLLMLNSAIELYKDMQQEKDVPIFCWLLFARDSSDTPCSFLGNHLNQVEMFLLGYALELTIHVYRLYKFETDEFITFYPDDHKEHWPAVCLITEDDRHYNVPVQKQDTTRL